MPYPGRFMQMPTPLWDEELDPELGGFPPSWGQPPAPAMPGRFMQPRPVAPGGLNWSGSGFGGAPMNTRPPMSMPQMPQLPRPTIPRMPAMPRQRRFISPMQMPGVWG